MQKGTINVQTENIFPIIKKFLYSDTEIFARELVSNAVDATQKLFTLSSSGEIKGDLGELKVELILDKKAGTLTIKDRGIGMTADEVRDRLQDMADRLPFPIRLERNVSWVHLDVAAKEGQEKVYLFYA